MEHDLEQAIVLDRSMHWTLINGSGGGGGGGGSGGQY